MLALKIEDKNKNVINKKYLGDSKWTCDMLELQDDLKSELVYPPVQVSRIQKEQRNWTDRENGFVCLGRIVQSKNILRNISIIEELRKQGYGVHLHIVGFAGDTNYRFKIEERIKVLDYIYFEGELSYEKMIRIIGRHRYGIHGQDFEHFGIVVAEMVAGGVIPFVPDSGGQVEIVNNLDLLIYGNRTEAVQKIKTVLDDEEIQIDLYNRLQGNIGRFIKSVFNDNINGSIEKMLER